MAAIETSLANAFETQLTANITDSDLTFPVGSIGSLTSPTYLVIDPDNPTKREYVFFDGTFTSTDLVTTSLTNRGLAGSASGAQGHTKGAKVRAVPMQQHFEDLHDRMDTAYTVGGADVAVADGGTGASSAATARTNLGAAADAEVVKLTGAQTVAGAKTFSTDPTLADGSSALSATEGAALITTHAGEVDPHTGYAKNADAETIAGAWTFSTDPTLADGSSALSLTEGNAAYRARVGGGIHDVTAAAYGATGDGATDDTAAIQAAIDAAEAAGGGIVFLPAGDYLISASLTFDPISPAGVTLRGVGEDITTLVYSGAAYAIVIGNGGATDARRTYIEDIHIKGNGTTTPLGAVRFNHARFCGLRRVAVTTFSNAAAIGVLVDTAVANYFNVIEHCRFNGPATGIKLHSDNTTGIGANSNYIRNCHFGNHATYAVHIDSGDTNLIEGCEFNGSITTAIYIDNTAVNNKVVSNQFDGPATSVNVAATAVNATVIAFNSGGTVADSGTSTLHMAGVEFLYDRSGLKIGGPNVLTNTPTVRVRAPSGQSTDILQVQNSSSTNLFRVDQSGGVEANQGLTTHGHTQLLNDVVGSSVAVTISTSNSATAIALRVRGAASQSGDLVSFQTNTGTVLAKVTSAGTFNPLAAATASRPSAATVGAGAQMFDTTLGLPIWSNGTSWIKADGTAA